MKYALNNYLFPEREISSSRRPWVPARLMTWFMVGLVTIAALTGRAQPARAAALSSGVSTQEVNFRSGDLTLHGTIWVPVAASHLLPGVVLVSGSGPGPRAATRLEAEAFAGAGIVVLAYDKRTVGYSLFQRSYVQLADDALAGVKLLRSNPHVDPTRVGLWGESEGTWVVSLAASVSTDVAFVILVGASGVSPSQQQSWFLGNILRHEGVSGSLLTAISITSLRVIVSADLFPEAHFDVLPFWEHLHQPVLAVWSNRDYNHPPQEASRLLSLALNRAGNTHYTIRFFADADPGLHLSTDGFSRRYGLAPGYVPLVANWVGAVAKGLPPQTSVESSPQQDRQSQVLAPLAWYESLAAELAAIILFLLAFAGYPLVALARCLRGQHQASAGGWAARLTATAGLITILALPVYLMAEMLLIPPGPLIASRPLPWLALQALAITTVGATAMTAFKWWQRSSMIQRSEQVRLGLLVFGGGVFGVWAI
ncbi:MAG: prolyl oligopeptidase family serine peptidase, partial [Chloroflexi bacterium]|nr:prolyl oligopeptidase family serine peptidase [Chloroflexota bacterium]